MYVRMYKDRARLYARVCFVAGWLRWSAYNLALSSSRISVREEEDASISRKLPLDDTQHYHDAVERNQGDIPTCDGDDKSSKPLKHPMIRVLIDEIVKDGISALPPTMEGIPTPPQLKDFKNLTTYENSSIKSTKEDIVECVASSDEDRPLDVDFPADEMESDSTKESRDDHVGEPGLVSDKEKISI